MDDRITWFRGDERPGARQTIGVLDERLRVDTGPSVLPGTAKRNRTG
jgi:hypothetical protein